MANLIRGQKAKLSDLTPASMFEVGIQVAAPPGSVVDLSCFGLDADGKLSDDRYFVFYNQKASPCGALQAQGAKGGDAEVFRVELGKLPATILRLVFTATVDGAGTMAGIGQSHIQVIAGGASVARFSFSGTTFGAEKALMVGELYFKDVWRFSAVGQGFNGGLNALLAHFGGSESGGSSPAAPTPQAPPAASPPLAARPPSTPVNLGKVTLEKRGARQAVNLKKGGGSQPMLINLNWDVSKVTAGFFNKLTTPAAPDLDLGCMFRMTSGQLGVIQPLGGNFGSKTVGPYIYLDKDDRSGVASDGENLYIYRPDLIDKVMVFAMIYEGVAKFAAVNARLIIRDETGSEILIKLDNAEQTLRFCAVCVIERRGDKLEITKEERYFAGHQKADEHYGFGFSWTAGRK